MKKILVLLCWCCALGAMAQTDTVTLGAGSTDMVFYNATTRVKTISSNNDWHLAFTVRPAIPPYKTNQAAAIRINEAAGMELYRSPNQKLSSWNTFDTTGWAGWQAMHNPDTTWTIGAFNVNKDFGNDYNYGWGAYAFAAHSVLSDSSIYLLKLPDGSFRKFAILNLDYDTAFNVQYDKLDNSDFTQAEIRKRPYNTKSFVYYNLNTKTVMDKEPALAAWDMVFTRYGNWDSLGADPAKEIGILTNDVNTAYAASGSAAAQECYSGPYSRYINAIGKSWFDTGTQMIIPGQAYFVAGTISGNYKLAMTQFDGNATRLIGFNINVCTATGIENIDANNTLLSAYPVPASDVLNVRLSANAASAGSIALLDMSGRVISMQSVNMLSGENNHTVNTSMLQSGNYILSISSGAGRINKMISVVK